MGPESYGYFFISSFFFLHLSPWQNFQLTF